MSTSRTAGDKELVQAEGILKSLCLKNGLAPRPEAYRIRYGRDWNDAINSLLAGLFNEREWFESPSTRWKKSVTAFKDVLRENGVRISDYQQKYGHRLRDGARLIYLGQELDIVYWITKKKLPTKEAAYQIISEICSQEGYDITGYQLATRRYLKSFRKYIQKYGTDRTDLLRSRWLTVSSDPERDPSNILLKAQSLVIFGQSRGLSQLDFGNRFKSLVRCFYPKGLSGLNADLELEQVRHIPEPAVRKTSEDQSLMDQKLKRLERRIDIINKSLDPVYLSSLKQDLAQLANVASKPRQDDNARTSDSDFDLHEYVDLEEALITSIRNALGPSSAFLYFKKWHLDERVWFKIGITNSLDRRDREQNVLPVPSETLKVVRFYSMDEARVVESALHAALRMRRVEGAKNRELYQLSGSDFKAVSKALQRLEAILARTTEDSRYLLNEPW